MDTELLSEINALEAALAALRPGASRLPVTPDLEARRQALLARHLGFVPRQSLPELQVIGDSHVAFFSGITGIKFYKGRGLFTGFFRRRHINVFTQLLPVFRCFHLGPATAWKAGEAGSTTRTIEKIRTLLRHDLPAGSHVLLSFGEIDCRAHLPRLVLEGRPASEVVGATVSRLVTLGQIFRSRGHRVSFWGPPCVAQLEDSQEAGEYVAAGSYELRAEITRLFGDTLRAACQSEGFGCATLAGTYHAWNQRPASSYLLDPVHLSQEMMPLALRELIAQGILDVTSTTPTAS